MIGCQLLLKVLFVEGLALEVDDARPQTGGFLVVLGAIGCDRPLVQLLDVGEEHWLLLLCRLLHKWVVPREVGGGVLLLGHELLLPRRVSLLLLEGHLLLLSVLGVETEGLGATGLGRLRAHLLGRFLGGLGQ